MRTRCFEHKGSGRQGPLSGGGASGLVCVVLLTALCGTAQADEPSARSQDPFHRESPQSTVVSFLEACHVHDYTRAARYLDLRKLPASQRAQNGPSLAQQLEQVVDHDTQFEVASLSSAPAGDRDDSLPPDRERVESIASKGRTFDVQLQRVPLRADLSIWLFASDTVAMIPQFVALTSSSIEQRLPQPLVRWTLVGTPLWRWIALALLAAGLAAISRPLSRFVLKWATPVFKRFVPHADNGLLEVFLEPARLLFFALAFRAGMQWLGCSDQLRGYLERGVALLFFVALAWLAMVIVDLALSRVRISLAARHQSFAYSVLPLATRIFKFTILLLAFAAVVSDWGYSATTILAGLGIGGIAIALAAQKSIENLFGSFAVIGDRPVSVGDFCRFGDRVGTVEDIGLRSTRLRTLERTLVTVPNSQFSAMSLENFSRRDKMWFHLVLNLRRDTTPDQVRGILQSVARILSDHPKVEIGVLPVRFIGVGAYSLDVEVFAYVLTGDSDEFLQIQQDLLLSVLDAVAATGAALALPTQESIYTPGAIQPQNGSSAPQGAVPLTAPH